MPTKGDHSRGSLFGNVLTGHTVDFATYISHLYKIPNIVGGILLESESEHIYSFHPFSLSIFRYFFSSILRYSSLFFIHLVFSALGDCLVCLVVKPAVRVTVLKPFRTLSVFGLRSPLECIVNTAPLLGALPSRACAVARF
jgi:hypothetical protein